MVAPRKANPTVSFIDDYCECYKNLFPEVRSFEAFKNIQIGMISGIKRKSLPAIAQAVGLPNGQGLHHFMSNSPWSITEFREARLALIFSVLQGEKFFLLIDDTGDRKRGDKTDYVQRQWIGNLGKVENGIVAVTAYAVVKDMTIPLTFEVYKPESRLKDGEVYQTKTQIAVKMIAELKKIGFEFELVIADCLYGESDCNFIDGMWELNQDYLVSIRSNHGLWISDPEKATYKEWREFDRIFSNGKVTKRYIREIVRRPRSQNSRKQRYWQITTDKEKLPTNSTCYVMSNKKRLVYKKVGNLYGERNWVEYGLKQSKNELGWADFRFTNYVDIEKWWELVCSAYLMVSLHSHQLENKLNKGDQKQKAGAVNILSEHQDWDKGKGWKNILNNFRLILGPWLCLNQIKSWHKVFPIPQLVPVLTKLTNFMNIFPGVLPSTESHEYLNFSSA